jgi:hypothetical protein
VVAVHPGRSDATSYSPPVVLSWKTSLAQAALSEVVEAALPGSESWIPSPMVTRKLDGPFDTEGTGAEGGDD